MNTIGAPLHVCDFCEKTQREVKQMVAGKNASICDECFTFAAKLFTCVDLGLLLPGWTCPPPCGAFNGTAKEDLQECRACGKGKP